MRVREWLDLAIAIESRSAELYRRFAELFGHHDRLATFWRDMEDDEHRHKAMLQDVARSLKEADEARAVQDSVAEKANRLLSSLNDDLSKVFEDLDEAYECAHDLEEREVSVLFDLLKEDTINGNDGLQTLLNEDQEHLQKLIDFSDTFGTSPWRKLIKTSPEA